MSDSNICTEFNEARRRADLPTDEVNMLVWQIVKQVREVEIDTGGTIGNYTRATSLYSAVLRGLEEKSDE